MNFLISQGQATRSTLTFTRVIHFMELGPWQPAIQTTTGESRTRQLLEASGVGNYRRAAASG
jgi:hypothetical protein